jgi:putative DNA primase/helicase
MLIEHSRSTTVKHLPYTELSPSRTGVHLIAAGSLSGQGLKTPCVEMYDSGRYFTVTGHGLGVSR